MAGGEQEKRLQKIMDKLYHSPTPKSPILSSGGGGGNRLDPVLRGTLERRNRLPFSSMVPPLGPAPHCRPWDRKDLMKRLATFKALTWFAKPNSISPVNCARRGWINVDSDVIVCEACGARLLFSTSASWSMQQVEKAAAVFSLKLDSGHKMLCPWIDNACDEHLALFPPTPPATLVQGYRERASMLLRLAALPVISSDAIHYMKNPEFEHFMLHGFNPSIVLGNGVQLNVGKDQECEFQSVDVNMYYQALKVISLCGWEPRLLPYVVDVEDQSNSVTKSRISSKASCTLPGQAGNNIIVQASSILGELEAGNDTHRSLGEDRYDPASIVLDCRFCGACVGLWAFPTTKCPLEIFRLVEDFSGQPGSALCNSDVTREVETLKTQNPGEGNQISKNGFSLTSFDGSTTKERPLGLNFTIAGGPPPAEQNFRPKVSFPIISRHLRAELGNIPGADICIRASISCMNQVNSQRSDFPSVQQKSTYNGQVSQPEGLGKRKRSEDAERSDPVISSEQENSRSDTCSKEFEKKGPSTINNADTNLKAGEFLCANSNPNEITQTSEAHENRSRPGSPIASNVNGGNLSELDSYPGGSSESNHLDSVVSCSDANSTLLSNHTSESANDGKASDSCYLDDAQMISGLAKKTLLVSNEPENSNCQSGKNKLTEHTNIKGFNPIHQHRPFCPWITNGDNMPGWKLTLSSLINQEKNHSQSSDSEAPLVLLDEDDDPVISVRKLFMSPPAKRLKSSR